MASQPAQVMLPNVVEKQANIDSYIEAFRSYGHISANVNPLEASTIDKRLTLDFHGLSEQDLSSDFLTRGVTPNNVASLKEIKRALELHYCGTAGFEVAHVEDDGEKVALEYIESNLASAKLTVDDKKTILSDLNRAEGLEKYLDVKYPGQNAFQTRAWTV